MGTKIEKAKPAEIIPSSDLPKIAEAIVKFEDLQTTVRDLETEISTLVIDSPAKRIRAGQIITELKQAVKDCDLALDPYNAILKRVKDYLKGKTDPVYDDSERLRKLLNPKMAEWDEREARAAAAEQARIQREAQAKLEREAEERRQADAKAAEERRVVRVAEIRADLKSGAINKRQAEKLLREAGATEEADKAAAAAKADEDRVKAAEVAAKITVTPNIPNVAGNVRRKNRKFKVVNPYKVNLKYMTPDLVAIGTVVRETMKDKTDAEVIAEVGGIEIFYENTF